MATVWADHTCSIFGGEYFLLPVALTASEQKPKAFDNVYVTKTQLGHVDGLSVAKLTSEAEGTYVGVAAPSLLQNTIANKTAVVTLVWLKVAISGVLVHAETGERKNIMIQNGSA